MNKNLLLRSIPKVDDIIHNLESKYEHISREKLVMCIRMALHSIREDILRDDINELTESLVASYIDKEVCKLNLGHLKNVVNASGIIIHTNLGRSLLPHEAAEKVYNISTHYSNLEFDLETGERGSRYSHVEELLKTITGAEDALVVNNNAAAVLLALNTLCNKKEAIVSRGQLVEIGGSFRIPDVMKFSGAELVEVGTTNRTHTYDYENAINENTGLLLKIHTSNFKILGFTKEVDTTELSSLGKKYSITTMEDIGSGTLIDFSKYGLTYEPTVQESIKRGIDIVTFSGDKMLGGAQAGVIIGKKHLIQKMKENQLTRALRVDKMTLAAMEETLKFYINEEEAINKIPTLKMLLSPKDTQLKRANELKELLENNIKSYNFSVTDEYSKVGGGSMPEENIPTYTIKFKSDKLPAILIQKKLREYKIPIIVRINKEEIFLDLRTIQDDEFKIILHAIKELESFEGEE